MFRKKKKQLDFKNYYQTKVYINKVESPRMIFSLIMQNILQEKEFIIKVLQRMKF